MSEYKLGIKQLVSYPRCRIYRQFIRMLLRKRDIRIGSHAGLFHYAVLCSYANFRTSYKRIDGISYIVYPGQWLCTIREVTQWFRVRFQYQALAILKEMQDQNLITYTTLGHGKLVKFHISNWHHHNRVLDYNAPCQKDTGFFFLPITTANELVSHGRCSEMDALLDLWINTIYNDKQVEGSDVGPVVYMRNNTGCPLISYTDLAVRWGISKSTAGRYLQKLQSLDFIKLVTFSGSRGTAIYLRRFLSTMFEISDILVDKDEVAMALNMNISISDDTQDDFALPCEIFVPHLKTGVSKSHISVILQKVAKVLAAQGLPCCECPNLQYKLLPLSYECKEAIYVTRRSTLRFLLILSCKNGKEILRFDIRLVEGDAQ